MHAQVLQKDSLLPPITKTINKTYDAAGSPFSVQTLTQTEIKQTASLNVGDAVKFFSGVLVKDYGGIGGLKTVSVRSLGANQTNVMYDGLVMPGGQGGQIDLSKISVNNIYSIKMQNAQPAKILNTARAFSATSILELETVSSSAVGFSKPAYNIGFKVGSFAFYNPVVSATIKLNPHWAINTSVDVSKAKGNYVFTDVLNGNIKRRRKNSDVQSVIAEANLLYRDSAKTSFDLKTYYYGSNRGLPGAIIYKNFHSNERLSNRDFFVQSRLQKELTNRLSVLLSARFSSLYNHYLKPGEENIRKDYANIFTQKEYYVSAASKYIFTENYSASYALDYFYSNLQRRDSFAKREFFPEPDRNTLLNNLAFKTSYDCAEIQLSVLHTHIKNLVKTGSAGAPLDKLSPTVSIIVQPKLGFPLRLRAFYKNIFRTPSFDDLYYTSVGNTKLRPELAKQYNFGLTYIISHIGFFEKINIAIDAYHNDVRDKIIAIPRDNLFQWSMQNLGKVKINGTDLTLDAKSVYFNNWQLQIDIAYTFQRALDVTDPTSVVYENQVPYTPNHSGSTRVALMHRSITVFYNLLAASYRYRSGETTSDNYLSGWATHGFTISYAKTFKSTTVNFFSSFNNIFNKQYDIVMNYPMPGFNYQAGFNIYFN